MKGYFIKDFAKRLTSRKFLIIIAVMIAVTLLPGIPDEVISLALAYVGAEGLADVVRAYKQSDVDTAKIEKDIALINMGEVPAGDGSPNKIVPGL